MPPCGHHHLPFDTTAVSVVFICVFSGQLRPTLLNLSNNCLAKHPVYLYLQ